MDERECERVGRPASLDQAAKQIDMLAGRKLLCVVSTIQQAFTSFRLQLEDLRYFILFTKLYWYYRYFSLIFIPLAWILI
jgi:hypothetical protein